MITAERLREVVDYNKETGVFTWKKPRPKAKPGMVAGSLRKEFGYEYRRIGIDRVIYRAHRLAWLYVYGCWPQGWLDHVNGICDDNRISNLREATCAENARNSKRHISNKSGYKGVYRSKDRRKWTAQVNVKGRSTYLGTFETAAEAHAAYHKAAIENYGEFVRFK